MVYILNIREAGRRFDQNLAIVRSMRSNSDFIVQEPLLAPSQNLFYRYLKLRDAKNWNAVSFREIYVPQFLRELKANRDALDRLNEIYRSAKTQDIALYCFCTDESLCHRSIIAGLLQGVGSTVSAGADYSEYYEMFKSL